MSNTNIEFNNPHTANNIFKKILTELKKWGMKSGATISIPKYKLLHICKKTKCEYPQLIFENIVIQ